MIASFTFWLIVLALLTAYLCASVCFRRWVVVRTEKANRLAIEKKYPPRAFDISTIAPHIKRVRENHAASSHTCWRPFDYRAELVAAARRLVTGMAYFHHARQEDEMDKHDT